MSKSDLLQIVWPGRVVEENTLQVHISSLRKVLGPLAIATIPGRGYRFTAPLDGHKTPIDAAPPAPSTPGEPRHNLPQPRTRFIGRDAVLAQCTRLLHGARLLTLTGIGGCGKTRLALALVQRQLAEFPDGAWFVDLAPLRDAQRVAPALAAALGLPEDADSPLIDRLRAQLADRRAVVVLDNCEHVITAAADLAEALVSSCALLKFVVTSREGLGVAGEQIVPVRPLSLPAASEPAAIRESEAVQLFVDRAGLVQPDFAVDDVNASAVADICGRLDDIALAIELAAARVGMLPVAEIGARLDDRFRFLTGGSRAVPRHQTLQAMLQWSHDTLPEAEQRLFRRLAVFASGCTLAAATAVVDGGDEYAVLALLQRLHDKSLLVVEQAGGAPPRYRMLETVRQYAQELLGAAGEANATRDRHLRCFVALAEQALARVQGPEQGAWMLRLAQEQEDLLAAHGWCGYAADGAHAAIRLVAGLWRYWVASAQLERGHALAESALARAPTDVDPLWHARARWAAGQIAFRMGRYGESLAHADASLALALSVADAEQTAVSLSLRAKGLHSTGRLEEARLHYERACEIARTLESPFWLGAALNNLAELHRGVGQIVAAQACYEDAIAISRRLRSPERPFVPLCNLARLSVASGKPDTARSLLLESLHLATSAELRGMGEDLLEVAAGLVSAIGAHAVAARFYGAAASRMQTSGSRREPVDEAFIAPLVAAAKIVIGAAAFAEAEAEGWALGHEAAIVEVRGWLEAVG